MRELLRKMLAVPGKMIQGVMHQDVQQSDNSKFTTDANGNASLSIRNKPVRELMRARMEELASKN